MEVFFKVKPSHKFHFVFFLNMVTLGYIEIVIRAQNSLRHSLQSYVCCASRPAAAVFRNSTCMRRERATFLICSFCFPVGVDDSRRVIPDGNDIAYNSTYYYDYFYYYLFIYDDAVDVKIKTTLPREGEALREIGGRETRTQ